MRTSLTRKRAVIYRRGRQEILKSRKDELRGRKLLYDLKGKAKSHNNK